MSRLASKTLEDIMLYLRNIVLFEKFASREGFLQRMETSVKIIFILSFVITVLLLHSLLAISLLYIISIILAYSSKISIKEHIYRTWVFIPLFTLVIAVPALFNIVTPGRELFNINLYFISLSITYEGIIYFMQFTLRVATIISFLILLLLTTRWDDILIGLGQMHMPEIFIAIINMTYRYIVLLIELAYQMLMSRRSRILGKESFRDMLNWGSEALGALFMKSYNLGNMIYLSMNSRGFQGKIVMDRQFNLRIKDLAILLLVISFCVMIIIIDRCII
jgi:cobalt/nickel transport system permease protein